jgi:cyclic pyranopterin phosphate synthase
MADFTHFDSEGKSRMVDVTEKTDTVRTAKASGVVRMEASTLSRIVNNEIAKGNVFEVARIAGIMAAKRTHELIPLCHPLMISSVNIDFTTDLDKSEVRIEAVAKLTGKTGVEMEALTAVSAAALTIYDMCKAVDKYMVLSEIKLEEKTGGKSGTFRRQ